MSTAASPQFCNAVVVMGVTCCGKTTVGETLAAHLKVPFIEGDRLHGEANIAKMSAGIPLTDDDRWPWLHRVGKNLQGEVGTIVSCSALKRAYREAIAKAAGRPVFFIHLHGSMEVLRQRIGARKGHFMPSSLLDSQLATLEIPDLDERAITIDIAQDQSVIVRESLQFLANSSVK
jgi:gluconokinase